MRDHNTIHERYWDSRDKGLFSAARNFRVWIKDLAKAPSTGFLKLSDETPSFPPPENLVKLASTPHGRDYLQHKMDATQGYAASVSPLTTRPGTSCREHYDTLDASSPLFTALDDHDRAFKGDPADAYCGAALRTTQKTGAAYLVENVRRLFATRVARHTAASWVLCLFALVPVFWSLVSNLIDKGVGLVISIATAIVMVVIILSFARTDRQHHVMDTNACSQACETIKHQVNTQLVLQEGYFRTLTWAVQDASGMAIDEARILGRPADGPDQKAFLCGLSRWLETVGLSFRDYQSLCNTATVMVIRSVEDGALFKACQYDFGSGLRVSKGGLRYLFLLLAMAISAAATWHQVQTAGVMALAPLATCVIVSGIVWKCLWLCDRRLRQPLDLALVSGLPGEHESGRPASDSDPSGPADSPPRSQGGGRKRPAFESKQRDSDRSAAVRTVAYEERRRRL